MRFPWSPPSTPLVGIDLGTSALKLVALGREGGRLVVRSHAMVDLPRDTIVENEVLDSRQFTDTLTALTEQAGVGDARAAIAIGGSALFHKSIQLPYADEFDLEPTIQEIAAEHVPFPMEEVYLDFAIQGGNEENPELMDVVLVACKRDIVDDLQLLLLDAGLELAVVDCAVYALQNAAMLALAEGAEAAEEVEEEPQEGEPPAVVLVNIGAHMTNVNVVGGVRSLFVRDHYFGGEQLTTMIHEECGCGFSTAERRKLAGEIPAGLADRFFDALEAEVMRSVDFFSSLFPDRSIGKALVTGGGALLPGLPEAMAERLKMEVALFDPAAVLRDAAGKPLAGGARMTLAAGLALRALDGQP